MSLPGWLTGQPVAHRGLHAPGPQTPENSVAAYQMIDGGGDVNRRKYQNDIPKIRMENPRGAPEICRYKACSGLEQHCKIEPTVNDRCQAFRQPRPNLRPPTVARICQHEPERHDYANNNAGIGVKGVLQEIGI